MSASTLFEDCGSVYNVPRARRTYSDFDTQLGLLVKRHERKWKQLRKSDLNNNENGRDETEEEPDAASELEQWLKKMKCTGVTGRKLEHFQDVKIGVLDEPVDPNSPSLEPYPDLEEEEFEFSGGKVDGVYRGKAVLEFPNGDVLCGTFREGLRHGEFRVSCSRNGVNAIYGEYVDDQLCGKAKVLFEDGDWLEGYFKEGILHGFGRYFDRQGRLKCVANHKNGMMAGTCWRIIRGGGCIVGRVDDKGKLTGMRIAYLYPDFKTALVGRFVDGTMRSGQEVQLSTFIDDRGIKVPVFTEPKGPRYEREVATFDMVTSQPMLRDPYESRMVRVGPSKVPGARDGLFARRRIEPNTVLAFYNGMRIKPRSKEDYDHPDWEKNAYKIFDPSRKHGTIDIPEEYRSCDNYVATMSHKTNHSFLPNAEFVSYDHPKYGLVPCLVSNHDIKDGEEIFVHYGYDLDGCPDWYEDAWANGNYPVPDSLREEERNWEDEDYQSSQFNENEDRSQFNENENHDQI